ncbi:unnamed protein product [Orchesella dallaii]|uniref:Cuticle protein n=1 Tax=Orchesella dallaii TaxID=48710 RepID=A0ABP1RD05_9HEXA
MAVLKLLVSVAVLGTVVRSQQDIYNAYSPGQYASAGGTAVARGTPRLIPVKSGHSGHQLGYRAAATTAYPAAGPAVLKRGRVLPAASPYGQQTLGSGAGQQYSHQQSFPQASHSQYRPAPQIQASPVHHVQPHLVQVQQPQQPAYYVQKAPVGRPLKTIKAVRRPPTTDPVETEEEEYPGDPNPQYNFSFDIKDDELTNYQNRQEERDGQTIKGSYSVVDPDGYVRTVTYTADPKNGFQAKVTREPTDVKIKFPVPTEAPQQTHQLQHKVAGPQGRGQQQQYIPQGQYQHQPQYQSAPQQYQQAAYATPQQTYAAQPSYVPRTRSRFAVQPQAATQPRLVTRYTQ